MKRKVLMHNEDIRRKGHMICSKYIYTYVWFRVRLDKKTSLFWRRVHEFKRNKNVFKLWINIFKSEKKNSYLGGYLDSSLGIINLIFLKLIL